jgi:hypothetical protein
MMEFLATVLQVLLALLITCCFFLVAFALINLTADVRSESRERKYQRRKQKAIVEAECAELSKLLGGQRVKPRKYRKALIELERRVNEAENSIRERQRP